MLIYHRTSLLESSAQTLVNTVNCVGVMGKGLAHAFKLREPDMFASYKNICDNKLLEPGKLWLWRGAESWVLNFPTKKHWRNPSRIEWIEAGLAKFQTAYEAQGIREIAFPRLGCGNGGLDWDDVRPLMEHFLADLPIRVFIHDHEVDVGLPEHMEAAAAQLRTAERASTSYESFMNSLRKAVSMLGSDFVDISTSNRFQASMTLDDQLIVEGSDAAWRYEADDIRGLWVRLSSGLVTNESASKSVGGGGSSIVSVLSVLPQVRPVEIQRRDTAKPEIAVEFTPLQWSTSAPPETRGQPEFAWH